MRLKFILLLSIVWYLALFYGGFFWLDLPVALRVAWVRTFQDDFADSSLMALESSYILTWAISTLSFALLIRFFIPHKTRGINILLVCTSLFTLLFFYLYSHPHDQGRGTMYWTLLIKGAKDHQVWWMLSTLLLVLAAVMVLLEEKITQKETLFYHYLFPFQGITYLLLWGMGALCLQWETTFNQELKSMPSSEIASFLLEEGAKLPLYKFAYHGSLLVTSCFFLLLNWWFKPTNALLYLLSVALIACVGYSLVVYWGMYTYNMSTTFWYWTSVCLIMSALSFLLYKQLREPSIPREATEEETILDDFSNLD